MKNSFVRLSVIMLLALPSYLLAGERADWWESQRELDGRLTTGGVTFVELARWAAATPPTNAPEAMLQVCVLVRAGMTPQAVRELQTLKTKQPVLDSYQITSLYHDACDNLKNWELAKAVAETFADSISELSLDGRLLKHWLESGWSAEKIDAWLADKPRGINGFWIKERYRFNQQQGRGDALLAAMRNAVLADPTNTVGALQFLDALVYAQPYSREKPDLAWFAKAVKPALATEADGIASRLEELHDWTNAAVYYRQAIPLPLTDGEIRELGMMCQVMVHPDILRANFEARTREGLARCLLELSLKEEAQKWMVEAQDIRKKHNLGSNALFAGKVQGASGQRVIEERIKAEGAKSETNASYWIERSLYYRGRNEPEPEESALKKALTLTVPQPKPVLMGKQAYTDWRSAALRAYADFLQRQKRVPEAVALLRREMETAPADTDSAWRAAHLLAFDFEKEIRADDEVLWKWLAARPKWEYTEERLLWHILQAAKREELDKYFTRAEGMAKGADPTRASTLGWVMNRMGFPKRSVPLLEDAIARAGGQELNENASFSLFESYLDLSDWKRAEALYPEACKRLTPAERPDWLSRIAIAAAKSGEKKEAMRIWVRVADMNPSATKGADDLVRLGLREELKAFYGELQKKLPDSEIPVRMLRELDDGSNP